jgi:hypothetical protein
MPQYFSAPLLALSLVLAVEGVAAAKTPAAELATSHEASASASQVTSPSAAPVTAAATSASDREFANFVNGPLAARIRICHISRHPRDGMPAEEHACPLFIADATQAVIVPSTPKAEPQPVRVD